jgi:colanic acid/amylovoran biosynthesis glycosyltransferase
MTLQTLTTANPSVRMAYLVSRYPAVSHTFILREVRQLRDQGFDIEVASINPPDRAEAEMTEDEREETARTYYVKQHGWRGAVLGHLAGWLRPGAYLRGLTYALSLANGHPKQMAYGVFYFTEALMLARWMRAHHLDHLHVHFATAAANVGLVMKKMLPIGLSLTVHGPDEFYDAPGQWLRQKFEAADFLVCIGRYARSQVMKLVSTRHWDKIEISPLGVDPERYQPRPMTAAFTSRFQMLCVGRLTPAKGQRILIEACRQLTDAGRNVSLIFVGTGPDEADLKAASHAYGLDHRIMFTGALNQDEVQKRYAQADVFVLPSFAEGIPVVLMEAMACGVPCVTTQITGIPELIRDGQDGLLVMPSDVDELVNAITRLIDDPELRARLSRAGRERVSAHYNLSDNVARLGRIFQKRLAAKGETHPSEVG